MSSRNAPPVAWRRKERLCSRLQVICSTGEYVLGVIQTPREVNQRLAPCTHFVQQKLAKQDFGNKILQLTDWSLMYFCDAAKTAATAWTVEESPGN